MASAPAGKCGYTYPEDYEIGTGPVRQSCCYHDSVGGAVCVVWGAQRDRSNDCLCAPSRRLSPAFARPFLIARRRE